MSRARNSASSASHSSSIGRLRSASYSALRGWNQARSLLAASSARKSIASGRNPVNVAGVATAMTVLRSVRRLYSASLIAELPRRMTSGTPDHERGVEATEAERGRKDPTERSLERGAQQARQQRIELRLRRLEVHRLRDP